MENKDKYNIKDDENYMSTASSNDCTGLIPANNTDEESMAAYQAIYPHGAPVTDDANKKTGRTAEGNYTEAIRPLN